MMNRSTLLATILSIRLLTSNCFSSNYFSQEIKASRALNAQSTVKNSRKCSISRSSFVASSAALLIQTPTLISNAITDEEVSDTTATSVSKYLEPVDTPNEVGDTTTTPVSKEPEPVAKPARTIEGCPKPTSGKPNNCVATANIKQLDTYIPPWTFEVSPDVAFNRLKGLIGDDPSFIVTECDESSLYLKVEIKRNFVQDVMEFLVKGDDKVIVLKSYEKDVGSLSDFGVNKKRVDDLLEKSSGVFSVMGGGMTADSYEGGAGGKRNGAFGQLKAFYGLQSGQGFQEVIQE